VTDIRQQLLAIFEIEQRDHLAVIRALLHDHAAGQPADLMEVFRRAHSLKGAARAVDLPTVEDLAHRIETLLSRAVKIEDIVAAVMGQRSLPDTSATLALLARLVDGDRGGAVPGQSGETKSSVPSLSTATGPSPPVPQPAAGTTARPSENGDPRQTVPDRLSMITMSMDRVEAQPRT
jgi:two-component system chemotaxis sensor kinase CheA